MTDGWLPLSIGSRGPDGEVRAEAEVGAESPWFRGHFPGQPLLPGVALLALVSAALRAGAPGEAIEVAGFKHVRFKQLVLPGQRVSIEARWVSDGEVRFEAKAAGKLACRGTLLARRGGGS